MTEREAFERYLAEHRPDLCRVHGWTKPYISTAVDRMWDGWQAALFAQAAEIERLTKERNEARAADRDAEDLRVARTDALLAERDTLLAEVVRLRGALSQIVDGVEVFDVGINGTVIVSMDPDDMTEIASAALQGGGADNGDVGATYRIAHDGFEGTAIGSYRTREGKKGVVLQQVGTKVVHVYGRKWLQIGGDEK